MVTVSIVLASYNRLALLKLAVSSALEQRFPSFEVLVVDDGSDCATVDWLRQAEASEPRLRVVYENHKGVAHARATGVAESMGKYVCILDSDDTLVPEALSRIVEALESHPGAAITYCYVAEQWPDGVVRIRKYPSFKSPRRMLLWTLASPRVPFKHSGSTYVREIAIQLGSYDRSLSSQVDIDLYLKFLHANHLPLLLPEPLVHFRMHKDSVSRKNRFKGLKIWFALIDRYGPRAIVARILIKGLRAFSELFKRVYMDLFA